MIEQTLQKLNDMRLYAMSEKLKEFQQAAKLGSIDALEMLTFMVDAEHDKRKQNRIKKLLRDARIKITAATIADLKFSASRNLNKQSLYGVLNTDFIEHNQNILISGATGVGKTYLACAIANLACTKGLSTLYFRVSRFLEYIHQEQAIGNYLKFIEKIGKAKLLVLDDLGPDIMNTSQRKMFMEVIEERYLTGSTIIASQLPLQSWHEVFGEASIADAICDRIFHNAFKIELKGESMRKK